jgi:hypothetical protein
MLPLLELEEQYEAFDALKPCRWMEGTSNIEDLS